VNELQPTSRILRVPRGQPDQAALELEMIVIDEANRRLDEVRYVNPATSKELEGLFNEAANHAGKYMAWVEYEILKAKKLHEKNRSRVILGKAIEKAKELKDIGVKMNEDMRDALIAEDPDCESSLDILNSLTAVHKLLESTFWSFVRSTTACQNTAANKNSTPTPNLGGVVGRTFETPQANFMGKDERKG
jgi:hypothetical protein